MAGSELEFLASEIRDWQKALDWYDAHGSEGDELTLALEILIDAKERLARAEGRQDDNPELDQLRDRLAELKREIEEEAAAERWAEEVPITVGRVGSDVIARAERHFGKPQGYDGVLAFCRHRLTNYDALLTEADRLPGRPQDILKHRVEEVVVEALKRVGIEEFTFMQMTVEES